MTVVIEIHDDSAFFIYKMDITQEKAKEKLLKLGIDSLIKIRRITYNFDKKTLFVYYIDSPIPIIKSFH